MKNYTTIKDYIEIKNCIEIKNYIQMKDYIKTKLSEFPLSEKEIVNSVLNSQNQINEAMKWIHREFQNCVPDMTSQEYGHIYEKYILDNINSLNKIEYKLGDANTEEDFVCISDKRFNIELKTRQNRSFNNTNSSNRRNASTKYLDPDEEHYFILIYHKMHLEDNCPQTKIKEIYFGVLSKNDFKNPNGTGAAYLMKDTRDEKCVLIYKQ